MSKPDPVDLGTVELQSKHRIVPRLRGKFEYHAKVLDSSEIDRMLMLQLLTPTEHDTLERFHEALRKGGFMKIRSIDWTDPIVQSDPSHIADRHAHALIMVVKMLKYLDEKTNSSFRKQLVDLVLLDQPLIASKGDLRRGVRAIDKFFSL